MDKRKIANQKVKTNITNALFDLLKEKSISEISITEIIEKAQVARASFYRNYSSKESVITTLIRDILNEYLEEITFEDGNFYTYNNIYKSFKCFKKYESQVLDLHRFGYGSILLDMLNQFHEYVAGDMQYNSVDKYELYIYIGALYNTALTWLQTGTKESAEELAKFFLSIGKNNQNKSI